MCVRVYHFAPDWIFNVHALYAAHVCTYITHICVWNIWHVCPILWAYMFLVYIWHWQVNFNLQLVVFWLIYAKMLDLYANVDNGHVSYIWNVAAIFVHWFMSNMCTVFPVTWLMSVTLCHIYIWLNHSYMHIKYLAYKAWVPIWWAYLFLLHMW